MTDCPFCPILCEFLLPNLLPSAFMLLVCVCDSVSFIRLFTGSWTLHH